MMEWPLTLISPAVGSSYADISLNSMKNDIMDDSPLRGYKQA